MSTDKFIFPQLVAPWMDAAKPTPEQVRKCICDWVAYGIRADLLLREQAARITELEAQLADAKKDAERYQWLTTYIVSNKTLLDDNIVACLHTYELDIVIDAAIQAEGKA